MMNIIYLVVTILLLHGPCLARKKLNIPYKILSKDTKGWNAIKESTSFIKLSKVFPFDRNLMKRIALVESTLNHSTNSGGIWKVPSCAFWGVTQNREKYGKRLKKMHKLVRRKFGITWSRIPYQELQRPLYSLIAARIYLQIKMEHSIPRGANSQGKVWSAYYHNCGNNDFTERNELTGVFKKVVRGSCHSGYKKCEHYCIEVAIGKGRCKCNDRFQLASDGKSCKAMSYKNPCTLYNGKICEHSCIMSSNTVLCTCPDGHYLHKNRYKCVDVNECNMSPCQHECHNSPGSYYCTCFSGFSLQADGKRCKSDRRDDCSSSNDPSCARRCLRMTMDGPCICPPGMVLHNDNETCIESNGCLTSEGFCHHSCLRTAAGFSCACNRGFMLDTNSVTCTDIDECAIGEDGCEKGCLNVPGTFRCTCPIGYKLNKDGKTCSDINECLLKSHLCKPPSKCRNTKGDYKCECPTGYRIDDLLQNCIDIDECAVNNGGCEQICHNVPGSHQCRCSDGYRLKEDKKSCEDINECAKFPNICGYKCINTPGKYKCICPPGKKSIDNGALCIK